MGGRLPTIGYTAIVSVRDEICLFISQWKAGINKLYEIMDVWVLPVLIP